MTGIAQASETNKSQYRLNKNLQFDGGIRFGVTNAADRFSPFVGVSARY